MKLISASSAVSVRVTVAAVTRPPKVVPPDWVIVKVPKASLPPITPDTVIVPLPGFSVKFLALLSLSIVFEKVKLSLEDVRLPLVKVTDETKKIVKSALQGAKLI